MTFLKIEPLEARIAPATISIASASITEGDSGTSPLNFTVSLSEAATEQITVHFSTSNGTAVSSGAFADYVAQPDTVVTFAIGEMSKEIPVQVIGDQFQEGDQTFIVTLSNPSGTNTLGTATATGTILNGSDSVIGLRLGDVQRLEGNATGTVVLKPTLSAPLASNLTLTLSTANGTAVAGSDFTGVAAAPVTILAGETSADFTVTLLGDTAFEATENFFVNLTGAGAEVTVVNDHPLFPAAQAQATARVYLLNEDTQQLSAQKVQWIDVDGDLVTMSVNKGQLPLTNTTLLTFVESGTVGGRILKKIDFASFGSTFAGASITITATKQAGFPNASDGRVDVGFIQAALFDADELRVTGVDLGLVTIDGDLAKITAGDSFSTPAISRLDVYSLGAHGATTLPAGETFESKMLGPISTVLVKQNLEGYLHVVGSEFGTIGTLKIGGELKGGNADNSGRVAVSGRLNTATIGKITGGAGDSSGLINGLLGFTTTLGTITVLGDIVGGSGQVSGAIVAPRIGNVTAHSVIGGSGVQSGIILSQSTMGNITLSGDLIGNASAAATQSGHISSATSLGAVKVGGKIQGGGADDSGSIVSGTSIVSLSIGSTLIGAAGAGSGSVRAGVSKTGAPTGALANIGIVTIGEDATTHESIKGGTGANSGRIDVAGNIASFTSAGDVVGGAANGSGGIVAGGNIDKLLIKRSLIGGDSSAAAFLDKSGFISALRLRSATINGDIESGVNGGAGIASSGAIRADVIDALTVRGNLTGNNSAADKFSPVIISATGVTGNLAIKSLTVLGNTKFAEILAGYNAVTTASNFRGAERNGDASIGAVLIGGTVEGVNIVAGSKPGTDGRFGGADDLAIALASGVRNDPAIFSQIASVVIKGAITPNPAGAANGYGIVAQQIGSIKVGPTGIAAPLHAGPANDHTPIPLGGGTTNFFAVEPLLP